MIILEAQSSATIVGDIQSNAVGVNARDLDFITMILSTKLYSKPLESFLREIVSNAWDSHVEAGVKDPILLEIGTDTEGRDYCRIQDFGVGLSPERFETIYKMMGSSTKRDSDDQIGGFGIGRFSSLAYSDTVYLTSNHDGIKYKYLMYKDGNKIKIDELFNTPTTDPNGFEVMVYFKSQSDGRNFQDAIRSQLIYFENLYISADRYEGGLGMREFAEEFNELRIKKYKTFSVNTFNKSQKTSLCIGKIRYPLNKFSVPNTHFNFDADYPIAVNFEIGELLVTPNREEIQYDDATIKVIEKKLNDVQDEINDMINLEKVRDYDDLEKYVDALKESHISINLYEDDRSRIYFRHRDKSNMKVTYKGEFYKPVITSMFNYINYDVTIVAPSDYDFKVDYGKLTRVGIGMNLDVREVVSKIQRGSICIGKQSDLNIVSKEYLRQSRQSISFINNMTWKDVAKRMFKLLNHRFKATSYSHNEYDSKGAKIVIKDALSKLKDIETFTNDSVPQDFIDKREALKKAKRAANITDSVNWNEEVNLFILQESNRYNDDTNTAVTTVSERIALESLRTKWNKFPVIYSFKGDPLVRELFWVFTNTRNKSYSKYRFVEIAPTKMDTLKQFPNFINVLDYMNVEYKKIRAIATAQYITTHYPHIEDLYSVQYDLANISTVLQEVVVRVQDYVNNNTLITYYSGKPEILDEIGQLCAKHDYYDTEMMGYLKEHDTLLTNSRFITLFKDSRNILKGTYNIIVDYALTKKLFRPNVEAVKKLRSETIFNIKKEENEIN